MKKLNIIPLKPVKISNDAQRAIEWAVHFKKPSVSTTCSSLFCKCRDSRITPAGVMCLSHWLDIPSCEKCGKPGVEIKMKVGLPKINLCRDCYCGGYSKDYLEADFNHFVSSKSSLVAGDR